MHVETVAATFIM